jgi:hypothetical protein
LASPTVGNRDFIIFLVRIDSLVQSLEQENRSPLMNGVGDSIYSVTKDFARIEIRLTPGKISMISLDRLTAEILSLPSASRAILADKLIESLEFDIDTSIQSAWSSEAKKRRDEVRDGSVRVIPGDDALAQVRNSIDL